MTNVITSFTERLARKNDITKLRDRLSSTGWNITEEVRSAESEINVYLIDSVEPGVVVFGCSRSDINPKDPQETIHWGHFVLAWDVIIDPEMSFDQTHMNVTIDSAVKSLLGLSSWRSYSDRLNNIHEDMKAHVLVVIDRENQEKPTDIIIAESHSDLFTQETLTSIVKNYVDS